MKNIIVTGSNRGIGLEIAKQLESLGNLVIVTARTFEKAQEASEKIGNGAVPHELDVSRSSSIDRFTEKIQEELSSIDVLINNAGIFQDQNYSLIDVPLDNFNQTLETNFMGPLKLIRSLYPLLKKSKDARIINLSSGLGALNEMGGGYPGYRISKTALNALSAILAADLAKDNIKVNAMCPGWVRTDMGGPGASREVAKGAETAVWLATEENIPNGKFLRDMKVIDW
jgi:NAD(P)-dependent dehydrogenase (short-subunit alcohol dehydrogenase family)